MNTSVTIAILDSMTPEKSSPLNIVSTPIQGQGYETPPTYQMQPTQVIKEERTPISSHASDRKGGMLRRENMLEHTLKRMQSVPSGVIFASPTHGGGIDYRDSTSDTQSETQSESELKQKQRQKKTKYQNISKKGKDKDKDKNKKKAGK
ncbi:hypothetical protein RFI_11000 [Reticulomyxa filosa]|uniref:Uncharacterized protein n=1 Tax=Reticulomyxa filosa TaxID=46433 RepID=X6NL73_RETFI|nr:hypothetical protein RFI_11000 [Reticulomyxa filosa]|eukprot:ETO26137.1 hypothetical protein RFI_11000 [Reticulomyxa filosa]